MVKGYWVARLNIHDQAAYEEYRKRNAIAFGLFGGKFLVRGGPFHAVVGEGRQHNVVIEFPSHDAAMNIGIVLGRFRRTNGSATTRVFGRPETRLAAAPEASRLAGRVGRLAASVLRPGG